MNRDVIRTENLSKLYGNVHAVTDMSLNVRKGEIYGFLGLNGAGKTTTIRLLLGMIRPTSGEAFMNGTRVTANNTELWKKVGSLVEVPYSYPELTVLENLEIFRRLHFLPAKKPIERIINKLELGEYKNVKVKNLSLGNNQRLGLAKALIHEPEILLLDEPSNGLDPAGIFEIREMLSDLAKNQGVTVFISSHILGEISRFATRIGIIHQGKLIKEIDANELEKLCDKRLVIRAHDIEKAKAILAQNNYKQIAAKTGQLQVKDESALANPDVIATLLVNEACPPTLLKVEEEDLESYFLRTIGVKGGEH